MQADDLIVQRQAAGVEAPIRLRLRLAVKRKTQHENKSIDRNVGMFAD